MATTPKSARSGPPAARFLPSLLLLIIASFLLPAASGHGVLTTRELFLIQPPPIVLEYHGGPLLKGSVAVNLIWYGAFSPAQRAIVSDFITSISPVEPLPASKLQQLVPDVTSWWSTTSGYGTGTTVVALGQQQLLPEYHLGKSLTVDNIRSLALAAPRLPSVSTVAVVLTAADVIVEGFCRARCGTHGVTGPEGRLPYIWVGNSYGQCPGQCAWPFYQPYYGPQTPPLVPPNGDVGVDGMIINIAGLLAATVTNPFGNGYFQGEAAAPQEAASACTGKFGNGSYPGYPGELPVNTATGGNYNARGVGGRQYLLPALWDPKTSLCKTLV